MEDALHESTVVRNDMQVLLQPRPNAASFQQPRGTSFPSPPQFDQRRAAVPGLCGLVRVLLNRFIVRNAARNANG